MTDFLLKADPIEDADGFLTPRGVAVATEYARLWVLESSRSLRLEREYPELAGLFIDIRGDSELAHRYAADDEVVQKAEPELEAELQKAFHTPLFTIVD